MDSIVIKKSKRKEYVFSDESIVVIKNNLIIENILMNDIRLIRYCSKFQLKDTLKAFFLRTAWAPMPQPYKSFDIKLANSERTIRLWMNRKEFTKIKDCLHCRIHVL